ncbi:MAG: ABC transporter ATP-binding protein [Anaerolineae bacterium]|nr:ABC transporter ATP-binding protein [Anaerolineae bacterium]
MIEVDDIQKIYGVGDAEVAALAGVSLKIYQGEFVAIMGPSGSGKSTLMNILGCLDRPTTGKYILDNEDVSNLSRTELAHIRNKKLGFIFQAYNLLPRISALDEVILPMMYQVENRVGMAERRERGMAALESVGLETRAHHLPNELSGGQQQRVAIARALINDPVLILADEPTGNLDTKSSYEIMDLLHKLHEKGSTIVMVTHEPDIARQMERIIHIRDGKLYSDDDNRLEAVKAKKELHQLLKKNGGSQDGL